MKFRYLLPALLVAFSFNTRAQLLAPKAKFTHADSLHGNNGPLRTCYDINYYHLDVKFDIDQKFISGSNLFKFKATRNFTKLQFDLYANLNIESIIYQRQQLPFKRDINAVF